MRDDKRLKEGSGKCWRGTLFFSVSLVLRGGCDTDMEQEQSKDVKREEGMLSKKRNEEQP